MSDSIHEDPSESARRQLSEACRAKDKSLRLACAITAGEALLLGVLVVTLADYWWMLPVRMRSTAAAVLVLIGLIGLARFIRFLRRPTPLKEVALDAESAAPELGCEASTAAEYLSGDRSMDREYEPELVAALEARTADHLRRTSLPYTHRLRLPAIALGLTLLMLIGFMLASPAGWRAVARAVLPFAKVRFTQVKIEPGNVDVPVGDLVEITSRFTGRSPRDPQFQWRHPGDQTWHSAPLTTRASDGAYVYVLRDVRSGFEYQVTGSDAISEVYRVTTYLPAEIKGLSIQIDYPAYTRLPSTTQTSPDIQAVRASSLHLQVYPTVPLSAARLHFTNSTEEVRLTPAADGSWTTEMQITKDTDYWIELVDTNGRVGRPTPHHITALADAPPKVDIHDPGQDLRAAATNTVPIRISVGDDFGIEEVQLVFHKLGGPEHILPVKTRRGPDGETTGEAALDLSTLDLHEFELVAYQARARDNNQLDGPGLGESPMYFIEVTDLEAGSCRPRQPGQKLNLLALQKQIIADTALVSSNTIPNKFGELAARQRDAAELADMYRSTVAANPSNSEPLREIQAALQGMKAASSHLDAHQQSKALAAEEVALTHLYQALKHMPELRDLPKQPPPTQNPTSASQLAVVLDPMKRKQEGPAATNQVMNSLQEAQRLAQAQADLNAVLRQMESGGNPADASNPAKTEDAAQGQGQGQGQIAGPSHQKASAQPNSPAKKRLPSTSTQQVADSDSPSQQNGQDQGKPKTTAQPQGKESDTAQAPSNDKGKPEISQQTAKFSPERGAAPEDLASRQEELSRQATDLAQRLARLLGKDQRLGHRAGQNANAAAHKMATAARELKQGNYGSAGVNGLEGERALVQLVAELRRAAREVPEWTDVADEDAPKQYEPLISEYLKQLSHAE